MAAITHLSSSSLLLLLLVAISAPRTTGQEVRQDLVSTNYLEVSWDREGKWFGVDQFTVNLTLEDGRQCIQDVSCSEPNCSFSTLICGNMDPCISLTLVVTGGNYSAAPLTSVTGPEAVTNFNAVWYSNISLAWHNPDIETGSPCHQNTVVQLTYRNNATTSLRLSHDKESAEFPTCVSSDAQVAIWTQGGNGTSITTTQNLEYQNSVVLETVYNNTCQECGCDCLELNWDYTPVCPGITNFLIEIDYEDPVPANLSTRSISFELESNRAYRTSVYTVDEDGHRLGQRHYKTCYTHQDVVENLEVTVVNSATLKASWDPPAQSCSNDPTTDYSLDLYYGQYTNHYSTEHTSFSWTNLQGLTTYRVCVSVNYSHISNCFDDVTTPPHKITWMLITVTSRGSLHVQWHYSTYNSQNEAQFNVSWGHDLQYYNLTKHEEYTITGYNNIDEVGNLCVAAIEQNLASLNLCLGDPDVTINENLNLESTSNWIIIVGTIIGAVIVAVMVVAAVYAYKRRQMGARQGHTDSTPMVIGDRTATTLAATARSNGLDNKNIIIN